MKLLFYIGIFFIILSIVYLFYREFSHYSFSIQVEGYTSVPSKIGYAYGQLAPLLQSKLKFPKEHNLTLQAIFIEKYIVPFYGEEPITRQNIDFAKRLIDKLAENQLFYQKNPENSPLYQFMEYVSKNQLSPPNTLAFKGQTSFLSFNQWIQEININFILGLLRLAGKINKTTIGQYDTIMKQLAQKEINIFNTMFFLNYLNEAILAGISLQQSTKIVNLVILAKEFKLNIPEIKSALGLMKHADYRDLDREYINPIGKILKNTDYSNRISKLLTKEKVVKDFLGAKAEKTKEYLGVFISFLRDENYKKLMNRDSVLINKSKESEFVNTVVTQMTADLNTKIEDSLAKFDTLSGNAIQSLKEQISLCILINLFSYRFLHVTQTHIWKWKGEDKKIVCDSANPLNIRITNMQVPESSPSLEKEQRNKYAALCK